MQPAPQGTLLRNSGKFEMNGALPKETMLPLSVSVTISRESNLPLGSEYDAGECISSVGLSWGVCVTATVCLETRLPGSRWTTNFHPRALVLRLLLLVKSKHL